MTNELPPPQPLPLGSAAVEGVVEYTKAVQDICSLIGDLAAEVKALMGHPAANPAHRNQAPRQDPGEMKINTMLAYRHLEDAEMRMGKAIQAFENRGSIYEQ